MDKYPEWNVNRVVNLFGTGLQYPDSSYALDHMIQFGGIRLLLYSTHEAMSESTNQVTPCMDNPNSV